MMHYRKLMNLIEDHSELLSQKWLKEMLNNPATSGYKNISAELLHKRVMENYKLLDMWLEKSEAAFTNVAEHYMRLGRERASEGLKESEVIYALIVLRTIIWKHLMNQGIVTSTIEVQHALEFYQLLNNFFDKATYYVALGYESISPSEQDKLKQEKFVEKTVKSITDYFLKSTRVE